MHSYVTFKRMTVKCECCKLPNEFYFKTKHDRVICKGCEPHNGSLEKQQRKLRDHVGLYLSELRLAQEESETQAQRHRDSLRDMQDQHSDEISTLNKKIEQLRAALHDGADPAIDRWLADEEVSSARKKRDRAYRARDSVFGAIWQIDRLHHASDKSPDLCSCGTAQHKCRELEAIKPEIVALRRWEDVQIDRLLDGLDNGLPNSHPEVLKLSGTVLGFNEDRAV